MYNSISRCSKPYISSSSYIPILSLLKSCTNTKPLQQVHAQIIKQAADQDNYIITQFVSLCISHTPPAISYAYALFNAVSKPNSYLCNTLIKGVCRYTSIGHTLLVFGQIKEKRCDFPDQFTYPLVIKACSSALAVPEGRMVHGVVVKSGFEGDVYVGSSLVDFYGKCREIGCARKVFDAMPLKNVVSWTSMIVGYAEMGDLGEVKKLFDEMPERNFATWNAVVRMFVRLGDLGNARKVFDEMPEKNVVSFTTMIDGYAKSGDMASARFLFDQLVDKDVVSWSALISGYCQNGQPNEAVNVFVDMCSRNVKPDEYIIVSLMSACSQIGNLELCKRVDSYVSLSSFDLRRAHVSAALVDMNAKCGNMERATILFEKMPQRDLISYCSMIQGLSVHGCGSQAVALFSRMIDEGLTPDDVAFTVILTACSRAGLVEEGCHYFYSLMNKYSITPSPDHYACMVDLLGRSGKLIAAYELLKEMPVESHASAWGALLWACKIHSETELGKEVAARLFDIEPLNAGNYVLLSDIYAAADQWADVALIRSKISERGIRKIRGCSCI